jgi:hypothetical protein
MKYVSVVVRQSFKDTRTEKFANLVQQEVK